MSETMMLVLMFDSLKVRNLVEHRKKVKAKSNVIYKS